MPRVKARAAKDEEREEEIRLALEDCPIQHIVRGFTP